MKIAIRNPERTQWMSGYGVINRALAGLIATVEPEEADVHLYASPPYSFTSLDPNKFNVGLTMSERHDLGSYRWHGKTFIDYANQMDLLLAPGTWCCQIFRTQLKPPTEIALLGHDHDKWYQPVRDKQNHSVLVLDRGRDRKDSAAVLMDHFDDINHVNCATPKPGNEKNNEIIRSGRYSHAEMQQFYREADVFFKWGREGWCFPNLEAMSAGCLLITNCAHLGYVEDGKNCLVFRNMDQLQHCLRLASSEPLTEIKKAGQRTAMELTWQRTREAILSAIEKHLS